MYRYVRTTNKKTSRRFLWCRVSDVLPRNSAFGKWFSNKVCSYLYLFWIFSLVRRNTEFDSFHSVHMLQYEPFVNRGRDMFNTVIMGKTLSNALTFHPFDELVNATMAKAVKQLLTITISEMFRLYVTLLFTVLQNYLIKSNSVSNDSDIRYRFRFAMLPINC